jgi:sporadic carbohydrate cluster 2OG-Fe(II) oxygenase
MIFNFETKQDLDIQKMFLKDGYVISNFQNKNEVNKIQEFIVNIIKKKIKPKKNEKNIDFLNNFHKKIKLKDLNEIRVNLITELNKNIEIKKELYIQTKKIVDLIVGNELAIQKNINLSIQLPNDSSSILNIHSDTTTGESPYQVVLWVPLMDVFKSKSMFVFPLKDSLKTIKNLNKLSSFDRYFKDNKKKIKFLNLKFGQFLIFSPNLLHGNVINKTTETRFSLNIRLKSLFSPYNKIKGSDRKLGYFYFPLNVKPTTILGSNYELPKFKK